MTTFETRPTKPYDVGRMARILRAGHQESIARVGCSSHRELRNCFYNSPGFCNSWFIDGELAAIYGVIGTISSPFVYGWAAFSAAAMKHPVATVKEFRRIHDDLMKIHNEILTTVIGGDEQSLRFAVFLGYHCEHGGRGDPAFSRSGRRDLMNYLRDNPEIRVPVGDGYAIALGYHHQA